MNSRWFLIAALVLVSGCVSSGTRVSQSASYARIKPIIPADEATCVARGGSWSQVGLPGSPPTCDLPTTDAGRACSDSIDCEGECLAQGKAGICSANVREFGCHSVFSYGSVGTLCRD